MKKQITLLYLFIYSLITCSAQPTLTHAGTAFQIGTTIVSHNGSYMSPGNSGTNQTWNFGSFSGPTAGSLDIINPTGTPYASSYPTSNICSYDAASGSYEYIEDNSSTTYLIAGESPVASFNKTSNKETIFIYPLSYNGTWTDSYSAVGNVSSIPFTRSGSVTGTADGWGTLITPNGTYTNVLRIHISQTYTDVISSATYLGSQDAYEWYKEGIHYPIFFISSSIYNGSPGPSTAYYNDAPAGVNELTAAETVSVYPTLSDNELFVALGADYSAYKKFELVDLTGRKILEGKLSKQLNTVNVQNVPAGNYFLRIFSDNAVQTRKVVIQ